MKTPIASLGVHLFALAFILFSCGSKENPQNPDPNQDTTHTESPTPTPPIDSSSYLVLPQLAFNSFLFKREATLKEARNLYRAAQQENLTFAYFLESRNLKDDQSALPVNENGQAMFASIIPVNNAMALASRRTDVCLCPNSTTGLCPCPGLFTKLYFVTSSDAVVKDDMKELTPEQVAGSTDGTWRAFKLTNLSDRKFTLTITAKFSGVETTYSVPMEIKNGMLYLDNERLQPTKQ